MVVNLMAKSRSFCTFRVMEAVEQRSETAAVCVLYALILIVTSTSATAKEVLFS
jgi:hypothetical protein